MLEVRHEAEREDYHSAVSLYDLVRVEVQERVDVKLSTHSTSVLSGFQSHLYRIVY